MANVDADEEASGATRTASTNYWLESGWLELRIDQEVLKILCSAVGYQGGSGMAFQLETCSTGRLFLVNWAVGVVCNDQCI